MAKLNQIIAIEKGVKARVYGELTGLNKAVQKPELFNGFAKAYQKKDEDGEDLPSSLYWDLPGVAGWGAHG